MQEPTTAAPPPAKPAAPPPEKDSRPEVAHDPAGILSERVANKYHVASYLGQTSAAWVYRAIHVHLAVPCFLKVAELDPQAEGGVPERLRREARVAASARHPALLRVLDAGTWDGRAYLAQELVEGPTLRQVIALGSVVRVPELLAIALDVLGAIEVLHRRGILVRAFEPERIFVRERADRREVKLFDLSRAFFIGETQKPIAERTRKGAMGIVVQSARYLSPEEIQEKTPDPRSDLYSFGLLLYELLTGEFPYKSRGGATSYIVSHLRELPRPLELPPERGAVPEDLPGIIRRLLAKRPEDRFESAEAAKRALEDVVVPDLIRYSTPQGQRVLEAWRRRVQSGCARTVERPASEDGA